MKRFCVENVNTITQKEVMTGKVQKSDQIEQLTASAQRIGYVRHFALNIGVFLKCIILAIFHLSHAIFPFNLTSHEWWGIWKENRNE